MPAVISRRVSIHRLNKIKAEEEAKRKSEEHDALPGFLVRFHPVHFHGGQVPDFDRSPFYFTPNKATDPEDANLRAVVDVEGESLSFFADTALDTMDLHRSPRRLARFTFSSSKEGRRMEDLEDPDPALTALRKKFAPPRIFLKLEDTVFWDFKTADGTQAVVFSREASPTTPNIQNAWFFLMQNAHEFDEFNRHLRAARCRLSSLDDDYQKLTLLGQGAFAQVHLAKKRDTQEYVALKVMEFSARKNKVAKREMEILRRLNHENILKCIGIYLCPEVPGWAIATDCLQGGEVFTRIQREGAYTEVAALRIMQQLFSALEYMHSRHVVHRDIKTENILLKTPKGLDIRLVDFGLAVFEWSSDMSMRCGSPGYVAPEILRGHSYGPKVDCFSSGVILHILITALPPFRGGDAATILRRNLRCRFRIEDRNMLLRFSRPCRDLLVKLFAGDPKKRPTSAEARAHPWLAGVTFQEPLGRQAVSTEETSEIDATTESTTRTRKMPKVLTVDEITSSSLRFEGAPPIKKPKGDRQVAENFEMLFPDSKVSPRAETKEPPKITAVEELKNYAFNNLNEITLRPSTESSPKSSQVGSSPEPGSARRSAHRAATPKVRIPSPPEGLRSPPNLAYALTSSPGPNVSSDGSQLLQSSMDEGVGKSSSRDTGSEWQPEDKPVVAGGLRDERVGGDSNWTKEPVVRSFVPNVPNSNPSPTSSFQPSDYQTSDYQTSGSASYDPSSNPSFNPSSNPSYRYNPSGSAMSSNWGTSDTSSYAPPPARLETQQTGPRMPMGLQFDGGMVWLIGVHFFRCFFHPKKSSCFSLSP